MDAATFLAENQNNSGVVQFRPSWIMEEGLLSLSSKFPLLPGSQGSVVFCTTQLSEKLQQPPVDADFDMTDPCSPPPVYHVLHDAHLKEFFKNPTMRKRLKDKGFITEDGYVKCNLREFNEYRRWVRKLKLDAYHKMQREERDAWEKQRRERDLEKQLLRDRELCQITKMREQHAKELMEKRRNKREKDKRKFIKLEEEDRKRREKFEEEKRRTKDLVEAKREKQLERKWRLKQKQEQKVRKIRIRFSQKRKDEEDKRELKMEERKMSVVDGKKQQMKDTFKRRCSLLVEQAELKRNQNEQQKEEHRKNVQRRTSQVQVQRRKSQALLEHCIKTRRGELERELADAEHFLEKVRAKKERELEKWKMQHQLVKDRQFSGMLSPPLAKVKRRRGDSEPIIRFRPRLKSAWNVNSALMKDLVIEEAEHDIDLGQSGCKPVLECKSTLPSIKEQMAHNKYTGEDVAGKTTDPLLSLDVELILRRNVQKITNDIIDSAKRLLMAEEDTDADIEQESVNVVNQAMYAAYRRWQSETQTEESGRVRKYVLSVIESSLDKMTEASLTTTPLESKENETEMEETARELINTAVRKASAGFLENLGSPASVSPQVSEDQISQAALELAENTIVNAIVSMQSLGEMAFDIDKESGMTAITQELAVHAVSAASKSIESLDLSGDIDDVIRKVVNGAVIAAQKSLEALRDIKAREPYTYQKECPMIISDYLIDMPEKAVSEEDLWDEAVKAIARRAICSAATSIERMETLPYQNEAPEQVVTEAVWAAKRSLELLCNPSEEYERELQRKLKDVVTNAMISAENSLERLEERQLHGELDPKAIVSKERGNYCMSSGSSTPSFVSASESLNDAAIASSEGGKTMSGVMLNGGDVGISDSNMIPGVVGAAAARVPSQNLSSESSTASFVSASESLHDNINHEAIGSAVTVSSESTEVTSCDVANSVINKTDGKVSPKGSRESLRMPYRDGQQAGVSNDDTIMEGRVSGGAIGVEEGINKAAVELAWHAVISAENSVESFYKQELSEECVESWKTGLRDTAMEVVNQAVASAHDIVHQKQHVSGTDNKGKVMWSVTQYVEGIINYGMKHVQSDQVFDEENYTVLTHEEAYEAAMEYSTSDNISYESYSLVACRVVNDVIMSSVEFILQECRRRRFTLSDSDDSEEPKSRRRRSSVQFSERSITSTRRLSYAPKESDFLSVLNRPPTPIRRRNVSNEEMDIDEEAEEQISTTNQASQLLDLDNSLTNIESQKNEDNLEEGRRDSPAQTMERGLEPSNTCSMSDILASREGKKECEISPNSSYVSLPQLNPSEHCLITTRVVQTDLHDVKHLSRSPTPTTGDLPAIPQKRSLVGILDSSSDVSLKDDFGTTQSCGSVTHLPQICHSNNTLVASSSSSSTVVSQENSMEDLSSREPEEKRSTSNSSQVSQPTSQVSIKSASQISKRAIKVSPRTSKDFVKVSARTSEQANISSATRICEDAEKKSTKGDRGKHAVSPRLGERLSTSFVKPRHPSEGVTPLRSSRTQPQPSPEKDIPQTSLPTLQKTDLCLGDSSGTTLTEDSKVKERLSKETTKLTPTSSKNNAALSRKLSKDKVRSSKHAVASTQSSETKVNVSTQSSRRVVKAQEGVLSQDRVSSSTSSQGSGSIIPHTLEQRIDSERGIIPSKQPEKTLEKENVQEKDLQDIGKALQATMPSSSGDRVKLAPSTEELGASKESSPGIGKAVASTISQQSRKSVRPSPKRSETLSPRKAKENEKISPKISLKDSRLQKHTSKQASEVDRVGSVRKHHKVSPKASKGSERSVPSSSSSKIKKVSPRSSEKSVKEKSVCSVDRATTKSSSKLTSDSREVKVEDLKVQRSNENIASSKSSVPSKSFQDPEVVIWREVVKNEESVIMQKKSGEYRVVDKPKDKEQEYEVGPEDAASSAGQVKKSLSTASGATHPSSSSATSTVEMKTNTNISESKSSKVASGEELPRSSSSSNVPAVGSTSEKKVRKESKNIKPVEKTSNVFVSPRGSALLTIAPLKPRGSAPKVMPSDSNTKKEDINNQLLTSGKSSNVSLSPKTSKPEVVKSTELKHDSIKLSGVVGAAILREQSQCISSESSSASFVSAVEYLNDNAANAFSESITETSDAVPDHMVSTDNISSKPVDVDTSDSNIVSDVVVATVPRVQSQNLSPQTSTENFVSTSESLNDNVNISTTKSAAIAASESLAVPLETMPESAGSTEKLIPKGVNASKSVAKSAEVVGKVASLSEENGTEDAKKDTDSKGSPRGSRKSLRISQSRGSRTSLTSRKTSQEETKRNSSEQLQVKGIVPFPPADFQARGSLSNSKSSITGVPAVAPQGSDTQTILPSPPAGSKPKGLSPRRSSSRIKAIPSDESKQSPIQSETSVDKLASDEQDEVAPRVSDAWIATRKEEVLKVVGACLPTRAHSTSSLPKRHTSLKKSPPVKQAVKRISIVKISSSSLRKSQLTVDSAIIADLRPDFQVQGTSIVASSQ